MLLINSDTVYILQSCTTEKSQPWKWFSEMLRELQVSHFESCPDTFVFVDFFL